MASLSVRGPTALAGVDLEVAEGMFFGLIGPNGAGKTTLVRILATLLQPDSGRAELLGHDVVAESVSARELLALTSQFAAVDELLTGRTRGFTGLEPAPGLHRRKAHDE
jgi:ABC-type multidrug transport system ATPase subunit